MPRMRINLNKAPNSIMVRVWAMYSVSPHLEMKGLGERTVGNVHKGSKIGPFGIVHIATSHN